MYLSKLKYPIAIQRKQSVMGGKNADLSSPRCWRCNIPEYYQKGGFQGAVIYSADGGRYEIERVLLKPLGLLDKVYSTFMIAGPASSVCNVDMELRKTGKLSLVDFCNSIRDLALANPTWWSRHSDRSEIEKMFDGCETFECAINDIGILDGPKEPKPKGKPSSVIDLR